jgi:branched-chain amino acid transport system substrate-binding protein
VKKKMFGLVAGAMSLALLTACGGSDAPASEEATAAAEESTAAATGDTILIGINYELSGPVATYGQSSVDGIEMAVDEINEAGGIDGKQIQLVIYDNKSEPAEATTLATKLMTQDNVLTVIGPATSGSFKATIPEANRNEIPVVSGSATADDVTVTDAGVQEYAFRTCFNDSFQGTAMARYALNTLDATTAVVVMDNSSDYAKGLAENFIATFTEGGGEIVGQEAYVAGDTDFNVILTRIRAQEFDVIYLPGYYNEAGLIIGQARGLGITAPILGADGFDSPTLLDLAGADALNDVFFSNHYSSLDQDENVQAFIENYRGIYGIEPNAFNALGYDTAYFVADAIARATELTGPAIQQAMAETENFVGVTGTFSIDENHNPVKSIVVIELADGVQASSEKVDA